MATMNKANLKKEIKALKAKKVELEATRKWALEKREACLTQSLLNSSEMNRRTFDKWVEKASEIGEAYYTVCDQIIELEEALSK